MAAALLTIGSGLRTSVLDGLTGQAAGEDGYLPGPAPAPEPAWQRIFDGKAHDGSAPKINLVRVYVTAASIAHYYEIKLSRFARISAS